jgi:hypothetical protein
MASKRRWYGRAALTAVLIACGTASAAAQATRPAAPRPASAPVPAPATAGWWDDVFADREATLAEVMAAPEAFRGRVVRFRVQFAKTRRPADVFHTQFDPDRWLNFGAWADEAALWDAATFRAEHPFFFMARDHVESKAVADAAPYARFALRARVSEVLRGVPWLEVLGATPLPGRMTEGSLLRLVKAAKLREHRRFEAAADEMRLADDAALPVATRIAVLRDCAACYAAAGRRREAAAALKDAVALRPDDATLAADYAAAKTAARVRDVPADAGERPASATSDAPASRPATGG